jgi:flagellin
LWRKIAGLQRLDLTVQALPTKRDRTMASINTNMSANIAANSMTRNERSMSSTMERLSTGLRINSAKDDAAGLAISSKMTSQINGLNQAVRNANDAISMIQVAEGAMKEVTNMFQRMRELAVQSISDSNTSSDRTALNNEYKQLSADVARVAENTQWNGTNILDGDRTQTTFQIGANASQTIQVDFGNLSTNNATTALTQTAGTTATTDAPSASIAVTGTVAADDVISFKTADGNFATVTLNAAQATALNFASGSTDAAADATPTTVGTLTSSDTSVGTLTVAITDGDLVISGTAGAATISTASTVAVTDIQITRGTHSPVAASDITSSSLATTALGVLDTAIEGVNSTRAGLGASMSRLEYASDNLQNVSQNTSSARSRVLDADYASETTELARTQIIQQASTAMLAQANQSQQAVLSLLR